MIVRSRGEGGAKGDSRDSCLSAILVCSTTHYVRPLSLVMAWGMPYARVDNIPL